MERDRFTIAFDEELELKSHTATRNRSMELSELVLYDRLLIGARPPPVSSPFVASFHEPLPR